MSMHWTSLQLNSSGWVLLEILGCAQWGYRKVRIVLWGMDHNESNRFKIKIRNVLYIFHVEIHHLVKMFGPMTEYSPRSIINLQFMK